MKKKAALTADPTDTSEDQLLKMLRRRARMMMTLMISLIEGCKLNAGQSDRENEENREQ
jgi:hypothetical protein